MEKEVAEIMTQHSELVSARIPFLGIWEEMSTYVVPHRGGQVNGTDATGDPQTYDCEVIYDTTASDAADTLAQGMLAQITPMESAWFSLDPPAKFAENEEAVAYYGQATELVREFLINSNFYPAIQELYIDRGAFGTSLLRFTEGTDSSPFIFRTEPIGTFCVSVDEEGKLDQVMREFTLTGRQAMKFFENELTSTLKDKAEKKPQEPLKFLHLVEPRKEVDKSKPLDPQNFDFRSVYLSIDEKSKIGKEGGLEENPYLLSRYRTWGGNRAYGWCPGVRAMPNIVQLNFTEKMQDFKAEQEVIPPMFAPDTMRDQIDLSGGAVNYTPAGTTKQQIGPLLDKGRYDIGDHRSEHKRQRIEKAYHVDMLEAISNLNDGVQRTAAEIHARKVEKVMPFSPTFSLLVSELTNPLLQRAFKILYRRGIIPPPPESIVNQDENGVYVDLPEITYTGAIALALEEAQNDAFLRTMEVAVQVSDIDPTVLDVFQWKHSIRALARNYGVAEDWLTSPEEMEQMEQARAAQQEQQIEMQQAAEAAAIAKDAAPALTALEAATS